MLKKSINLLKNNSILILLYFAYIVISFLILYVLYPKDMSQFNSLNPSGFDFAAYIVMMIKMLIASLLSGVLGLLFLSGFGSMLSEAIKKGKTSISSFLPGIQRYFVRILLAMLLLLAFSIGFSIVISIIIIPITLFLVIAESTSITMVSLVTMAITMVVIVFICPFILLWFPSILIDDIGVMKGLANGAKAGVKNYWKLVLIIVVIYLPITLNTAFSYDTMAKGIIFTPTYLILYLLTAIISIVALPIIFMVYNERKQIVN